MYLTIRVGRHTILVFDNQVFDKPYNRRFFTSIVLSIVCNALSFLFLYLILRSNNVKYRYHFKNIALANINVLEMFG